ncbi:hypothetical protein JL720_1711 [Aureococcus anophagefferens]|nr:hypothetical protein JL720_1711 [Aureococcus anophagefferens]
MDDDDDARAQRQSFAAPAWQRRANVPYITTSAQDGGAYDDLSGYDSSSQLNVGSSPGSSTVSSRNPSRPPSASRPAGRPESGRGRPRTFSGLGGGRAAAPAVVLRGRRRPGQDAPARAESNRSLATVIRGARAERPERPERAPRVSRTAELQEEAIEAAAAAFASTRDFAEGSRGTAPEETYHDDYATIHRARRRSSLHATRQRRVSDAMMREDILREMRLRGQNIVNDLTDQTKRRDAATRLQAAARRRDAASEAARRREYEAYVATLALRFRETRALEKVQSWARREAALRATRRSLLVYGDLIGKLIRELAASEARDWASERRSTYILDTAATRSRASASRGGRLPSRDETRTRAPRSPERTPGRRLSAEPETVDLRDKDLETWVSALSWDGEVAPELLEAEREGRNAFRGPRSAPLPGAPRLEAPSLWDATCARATTAPYGKSLAERSLGTTVSGYLSDAGNRRLVEAHDRPLCTVTWLPPAAPEPVATRSARNSFSGLESIQESTLFGGPSLATRLTVETAKAPKRKGAKRPATSYSRALEKFVPPAVAAPAPPALHVRRFRPTEVFTYGDGGAPRRSEVQNYRPNVFRGKATAPLDVAKLTG